MIFRRVCFSLRGFGSLPGHKQTSLAKNRSSLKSAHSSRQRLRAEAEEECEDCEADAAHGGRPRQKYAIRRPAQTAPSQSISDASAVTLAPADASAPPSQ